MTTPALSATSAACLELEPLELLPEVLTDEAKQADVHS
jgi:hypothetical protein